MTVASSPVPLGRPRKQHGKRALATWLRERGVFSAPRAVDVALDVCDALASVHENGMVHGQLGLRCVRLALSRDSSPRDVEIFTLAASDESGVAAHAAPFLAPEQRELDRPIDARADLWALGALLYTMLVGRSPSADVQTGPGEEGGTIPSGLAQVVRACLATDPARRPQSVDELAEKIASYASWPPDRFARLAERRDRRAAAELARKRLESCGLADMPHVLDKLDDAAVARAKRDTTTRVESIAHETNEVALERLRVAVHERTESARVERALALPLLVDFDDPDEEFEAGGLGRTTRTDGDVMLVARATRRSPPPPSSPPRSSQSRRTKLATVAPPLLAAFLFSLCGGYVGFAMSARRASGRVTPLAAATLTTTLREPQAPPAAPLPSPTNEIPVFTPAGLPEATITPASLPEARR